MRNDSSFSSRFKVDLIILGILIVVGLAVLLHKFPLQFSSSDSAASAAMPQQMGVSEVLLVLPAEGQNALIFEDLDFSFAWYNTLAQEFGAFNIELSSNITDDRFHDAKIVVIPAKTAATFSDAQIQSALSAIDKGAIFIVEMPPPTWAPITAIKRKINTSAAIKRFTDAPNSPLGAEFREHLLNTPLDTKVLRIDALDSDTLQNSDLLLELDGAIAHYRRNIGKGAVYVLAFDLGNALTSLQQGKPTDDFHIEKLDELEFPTPADLVLNEKLKTATVPYADVLKKHVIYAALQSYPQPLLWPFPNTHQAAIILTHEENGIGQKALNFIPVQEPLGASSTFFASTTTLQANDLSQLRSAHFELGAQFIRPPAGELFSSKGLPFFEPISVAQNMKSQRQILINRSKIPITSCKIYKSTWSDDYFTSLKLLAGAGCQIDSSYGPSSSNEFGFLFGTAFPFLPIDRNGLPLPIYEFPTLFTDAYPVTDLASDAADQILAAATKFATPAVMNFTADAMLTHPHHTIPTRWLNLLKSTKSLPLWHTNLRQFMLYYSLRRQAQILSKLDQNTLYIDLHLPPFELPYTIAVAARFSGQALQSIQINDTINDKGFTYTQEGSLVLIAVPAGDSKVIVHWGAQNL